MIGIGVVLMTICLGAQAPIDGFERAAIITTARATAKEWREAPNDQRRQQVAQVVVSDHLIVGEDRVWFRKVLEWACRPYDRPSTDVLPAPVQTPPEPVQAQPQVYYYVPQAYYYQTLIRGSCATGSCPR